MASFTDQISTFNPYIQQLPTEAMVQVGMQKQAQYNQGVQKVQSYIDNVAGMDVLRPQDKEYVQSKMNELGNNLKAVAAGDFSNQQLVNSVGGMATNIVKDPRIQNAVSSTQKLKQGMADKTAANKAGKGSVDNDWFFDQGANKYLNDQDINASYSGGYIEYKDLKPKMIETLKSLHESGDTKDIPWSTYKDKDGVMQINYHDTAKAMVETGWKGITSDKIKNALSASLDENDLRQLQISGMYQFRNYTPDDLAKHAQDQYDTNIKTVTDRIQALQKYAAGNAGNQNLYSEANNTIKELQEQIGEKGAYRGRLKNQLDSALSAIHSNPDAVKAEMYKNATIGQFADSHAWEESVTKYMSNPLLEADHWLAKFNLDQSEFNERVRQNAFTRGMEDKKYNLEYWKAHGGQGEFVAFAGKGQESKLPSEIVKSQIEVYKNNANNELNTLASQIQANARKLPGNENIVVSASDAEKIVNGTYNGPIKNPISPELKSTVSDILENRRQAGLHAAVINNATEQMKSDPEMQKIDEQINQSIANQKPVTLRDPKSGHTVTYTPRELFDFLQKPVITSGNVSVSPTTGAPIDSSKEDLSKLTDKEKLLYRNYNRYNIQSWANPILAKQQEKIDLYNKKYNDLIAEKVPEYAPKISAIQTPSETSRSRWETMTVALSNRDAMDKGGYDDWDNTKVRGWVADPKIKAGLQYSIYDDGIRKQLMVTGPGGDIQRRTLESTEVSQIPEAQTSSSTQVRNELLMGGGTTNSEKNGGYEGAKWKEEQFPLVKKTRVVADAISDRRNPSVVFPKFQVKTSQGWMPIQVDRPMTVENLEQYYGSLDDAQIRDVFRHYYPHFKGKLE